MPTWKAWIEADCTACGDLGAGQCAGSTRASVSCAPARPRLARGGESVRPASRSSSAELNCAETTAPMRGDGEQARDARDRVVDARGDAGVGLVGVGEHGRRQRRDRGREPEREDEQRREQVGGVVEVARRCAASARGPAPTIERAEAHEQARPEPVGEAPGALREREHDERRGHQREPGLRARRSPRPAAGTARGRRTSRSARRTSRTSARLPIAKLRRLKSPSGSIGAGVRCSCTRKSAEQHDAGERRPHTSSCSSRRRAGGSARAPARRGRRTSGRRRASRRGACATPRSRAGTGDGDQHQRERDERDVDREDQAPRDRVHEIAADERPDHRRDARPGRPRADRRAALGRPGTSR